MARGAILSLTSNFKQMHYPFLFRLDGTVIQTIWWKVLLIILYSTVVVCISNYVDGWKINFPLTLVPVMGVVTGLLLVFRTNTAYDRYWEGRKLWSTMTYNIRTLTRCFWVLVQEKEGTSQEVIEKASAINLLVAFAYATRNYLREEYSYDGGDLPELISHIPKFSTPSSTQPLEDQQKTKSRKNSIAAGKKMLRSTSLKKKVPVGVNTNVNIKAYETSVPTNIPIELSYYIASYINSVRERELVDYTNVGQMNTALNNLVECLGGFERILRTPIPLAYSVHLHQATYLYLLALPFQLIGALNWFTIPTVAVASFALLGILGIGWEIENPFGYDANDLPLDDFCKVIHQEVLTMISRQMPKPDDWLLSNLNHPLAPECPLKAGELMNMPKQEVLTLLAKGSTFRLSSRKFSLCETKDDLKPVAVTIDKEEITKVE